MLVLFFFNQVIKTINTQVVNLDSQDSSVHVLSVRGGYTLELCLARWWSSLVDGQVELSVQFHSLRPVQEEVGN